MRHQVFVYGTLLRGEVNHHLLAGAWFLGPHRTLPCFALYLLGAYPGAVRGGHCALIGEVYALDQAGLRRLDRLEDYPRLYDRRLLPTAYGHAWIYLYRGALRDRPVIPGGDWRAFAADPDSMRAAGVRRVRDPKTRGTARTACGSVGNPLPIAAPTRHPDQSGPERANDRPPASSTTMGIESPKADAWPGSRSTGPTQGTQPKEPKPGGITNLE